MKIIEEELNNVKVLISESFNNSVMDEELKSFVLNGSKFIRSSLAILFFKALNLELNDVFYKILSSGEFVHNASLLHDDVLYDAQIRRGVTTISQKYTSKISILAGDYLLSSAIEKLLSVENFEVLDLFRMCTKKMSEAEIKQFFSRGKLPSKDEYINICIGKTASLFSSILEACAIILDSDREIAKKFGELFGLCFQIRNDLNKESAIIDKQNGIYTAVDIFGIEKTNSLLDNYKEEIMNIVLNLGNNIYRERLKDLIGKL